MVAVGERSEPRASRWAEPPRTGVGYRGRVSLRGSGRYQWRAIHFACSQAGWVVHVVSLSLSLRGSRRLGWHREAGV